MKQVSRKLWSLALCLLLLAGILPLAASAEEKPQITVAGVTLSESSPYAKTEADGTVTAAEESDCNIVWEASRGTLKLQGAAIRVKASDLRIAGVISANTGGLTLDVSGENTISLVSDKNQVFSVIQNLGGSVAVTGGGSLRVAAEHSGPLYGYLYKGGCGIYSAGGFQNNAELEVEVTIAATEDNTDMPLSGIQCGTSKNRVVAPDSFQNTGSIKVTIHNNNLNAKCINVSGIAYYGTKFQNSGSITVNGCTTNGNIYGIYTHSTETWENQKTGVVEVDVTAYGGYVEGFVVDDTTDRDSNFADGIRVFSDKDEITQTAINYGRITAVGRNMSQTRAYEQANGLLIYGYAGAALENYGYLSASGLEGDSSGVNLSSNRNVLLKNEGTLEALAVTRGLQMINGWGIWNATGIGLGIETSSGPFSTTLEVKNGSRLTAAAKASDTLSPEEQASVTEANCQAVSLQQVYYNNPNYSEAPQGIVLGSRQEIREGGKPFSSFYLGDDWVYTNTIGSSEDGKPANTVVIVPRQNPTPVTRYTLTVSAGEGGSIEPSGTVTVAEGGSQSFLFTSQENWWLAGLEVDGTVQKAAGNSYTFADVAEDHTLRALFLPFTDMNAQSWYAPDAAALYDRAVMLGVSGTEFGPGQTTSRGMVAAMLWRMEGSPEPKQSAGFTDVKPGAYYEKAVDWAAETGIASGYGNQTFGPDDAVTREQLAAVLYRYAQYQGMDVSVRSDLSKFADADEISAYAKEPMEWANAVKLIVGRTETELVPKGTATRAETAALLNRFLSLK